MEDAREAVIKCCVGMRVCVCVAVCDDEVLCVRVEVQAKSDTGRFTSESEDGCFYKMRVEVRCELRV